MESNIHRWTLGQIAEALGGDLVGPPDMAITGPAPADSDDPAGIAFCESEDYRAAAEASGVGAVILPRGMSIGKPHILVDQARVAFGKLLAMADRPLPLAAGIHPTALVDASAIVDPTASVGPYAVIERGASIGPGARVFPFCYVGENCVLDADATMYPNAVLYKDVRVGARSIIHSGAVIGADGFGFAWDGKRRIKIPQVGRVVLGSDVEVGACTTVDRATAGETTIGSGTKVDNLVQIAHNVRIGADGAIAGQTGISGSSKIGDRVVMAGQSALSDHATLGNDITFAGRTATSQDILEPGIYFGTPARPIAEAMRGYVLAAKLPDLFSRLRKLERRLADLEGEKE